MTTSLPPVGTNALLEQLSGYVPDEFIGELCPRQFTGGRRRVLSAAQLWRTHLLAGLTVHALAQSAGRAVAGAIGLSAVWPLAARAADAAHAP